LVKARVGRAVRCAPLSANGHVRVCHGGAHGVTRPTSAPAFFSAAARRRFGMGTRALSGVAAKADLN